MYLYPYNNGYNIPDQKIDAIDKRMRDVLLDVFEAIKGRRSIRAYTDDNISDEIVRQLIDAARWAPSAGNLQPWEFIIVRDAKTKEALSAAALDQTFIETAPVVIVVCTNEDRTSWRYGSRGVNLYCLQDTAAAVQTLVLAAFAIGLGTCWIGAFREETAKQTLKTPEGVRPIAIIPLGYPAKKPRAPQRRPIDEIVHYESFGDKGC